MSTANPHLLTMWTQRTKCWMCKHRFQETVLLPVDTPKHNVFQPHISAEVLFHLSDTHGLPPETVREWIIGSVYGWELNEVGIKGFTHDF